jgi:hypothetical protein
MKNIITRFFIIAILVLGCQSVFAQNTAPVSGLRLADIEQEMFHNKNSSFIIIDLMIDGLKKPGDACAFMYKKGVVYLDGKKMQGKMQEKYANRMQEFYTNKGGKTPEMERISFSNVTANDILDPSSAFRRSSQNAMDAGSNTNATGTSQF